MAFSVTIHYDNSPGFGDPHLWVWYGSSLGTEDDLAPAGVDSFGPFFRLAAKRRDFGFKFKDGPVSTRCSYPSATNSEVAVSAYLRVN